MSRLFNARPECPQVPLNITTTASFKYLLSMNGLTRRVAAIKKNYGGPRRYRFEFIFYFSIFKIIGSCDKYFN